MFLEGLLSGGVSEDPPNPYALAWLKVARIDLRFLAARHRGHASLCSSIT
jgi:hypothetical protein